MSVVLKSYNGNIFYKGIDDHIGISYAIEDYLSGLSEEEIHRYYDFSREEEVERCKNETLTSIGEYTLEEAKKISMVEFDKTRNNNDDSSSERLLLRNQAFISI